MPDPAQTNAISAVRPDATSSSPSGADLARLMLQRARQDAKQRGADRPSQTRRPRKTSGIQFHGRAPVGLAGAFQDLLADRGWDVPAAGGTILDRWPDIAAAVAPTLAAHTAAVAYDPEAGQLDLVPDSPAYATQLRLMTPRIIAAANEQKAAGAAVVRTIRVRQPGALPANRSPLPAPRSSSKPAGPVKTRETASEGFRYALAAHHTAYTPVQQDPALAAAAQRQEQARRDNAQRAFPNTDHGQDDEAPMRPGGDRTQQRQANEAVRVSAILRARAERAGRPAAATVPVPREAIWT
ncbi:DciA family protein [Streptomyces sp. NPDC092046]|uniref:DciA family protein n=1 Tax=Streptomyces sp. NPDC092046 TaxID=3366009 RepID=UPI0037F6F63E